MADLKSLEEKLNSDENFQKEFLKDPVETLKNEGVILSPEMEEDLKKSVGDMVSPHAAPPGSSVKRAGGIGISISKRF